MEPGGTEKMTSKTMDNLGIIAAGGPAPGINGVISSATIEARNRGKKVIGILDGFKWISRGDTSKILDLNIQKHIKNPHNRRLLYRNIQTKPSCY